MDRRQAYTGALPQDLDINQNMQFAMVSDGFLAETILGQVGWCYGLTPIATTPASMSIMIGRGAIGQMLVVDATNPGSSAISDTTDPLAKVGINLTSTTETFVAPGASGQSQVFLIEGQVQETDAGAIAQPYYNSANPAQPFSGPNNTGASSNVLREQRAVLQVVAGAPAATGSQVAPGPTLGWLPLYLVTISNGTTSLTAANFSTHPSAPFVDFSLPAVRAQLAAIITDAGLVPSALTPGMTLAAIRTLFGGGNGLWQYVYAAGTITAPVWAAYIEWELIGGGGGGGAAGNTTSAANGGGGGAGGFASGLTAVASSQSIACVIGAGGASSLVSAAVGAAGGATTLGTIGSGTGGYGGSGGNVNYGAGGAGGVGFGGTLHYSGQNGGDGGLYLANGAGFGGSSAFGGGGTPSTTQMTLGIPGTGYGTGGGGSYNGSGPGGAGQPGLIRYRWRA